MTDRAGVFDDDLADFRPRDVRGLAEQAGFRSREPAPPPPAPPPALPLAPEARPMRRYRTGRNQQLNLKVRAEDAAIFYAIADAQGWVLGEAFAQAIAALKGKLADS